MIQRAKEVLKNLESGEFEREGEPRLARSRNNRRNSAPVPQLSLFDKPDDPLRKKLDDIDISVLTPLEALNLLDQLKQMV